MPRLKAPCSKRERITAAGLGIASRAGSPGLISRTSIPRMRRLGTKGSSLMGWTMKSYKCTSVRPGNRASNFPRRKTIPPDSPKRRNGSASLFKLGCVKTGSIQVCLRWLQGGNGTRMLETRRLDHPNPILRSKPDSHAGDSRPKTRPIRQPRTLRGQTRRGSPLSRRYQR